jgi:uncharacterized protein YbjT (DUF2867 family)
VKVLVAGGTGYVGTEVVRRLVVAGHGVRAMVHRSGGALAAAVETVPGNVASEDEYARAAEGVDAIVHLVAILDGSDDEFEQINAQGPAHAVSAARRNGIRRLLHMSALGVTEEHAPLTRYWGSKWRGRQAVAGSGLEWTIFEPSFVFGQGRGALATFEALLRLPLVAVVGDGRYRHQVVWIGDVAQAFVTALEHPERTSGRVYQLGGPQALAFDDLLDELARATGRKPRPKVHLPAGMMKAQAALLKHFPPPLKVTREQIVMLLEGTECDLGPMRDELGIQPASLADAYTR